MAQDLPRIKTLRKPRSRTQKTLRQRLQIEERKEAPLPRVSTQETNAICGAAQFKLRMNFLIRLFEGYRKNTKRQYSQLMLTQTVKDITDGFGTNTDYRMIRRGSETMGDFAEINHVAISVPFHAIATSTPGGTVEKHTEQFALSHLARIIDPDPKIENSLNTRLIISTYSPCGKCVGIQQIEALCKGKTCYYLYGRLWDEEAGANHKISPPTTSTWKRRFYNSGNKVYNCDLPWRPDVRKVKKAEQDVWLKKEQQPQKPHRSQSVGSNEHQMPNMGALLNDKTHKSRFIDYNYMDYVEYDEPMIDSVSGYNYDDQMQSVYNYHDHSRGDLVIVLVLAVGIMVICGVCCLFMSLLSYITGYGVGKASNKLRHHDDDDDSNVV